MPRISEFYGVAITMNFADHDPPHFHARYGEYTAVVGIDPIATIRGRLPARVQSLVFEWSAMHRHELIANWRRATRLEPVERIAPLV